MARRELLAAGAGSDANSGSPYEARTWTAVIGCGRIQGETVSASSRIGAPGSLGGRETSYAAVTTHGGPLAYDIARHALSETEFYDDLKMIDIPVLVMHGEDDQICPFPTTGARSVKLLKHGTLKSYPGFPHGCRPHMRTRSMLIYLRSSSPDCTDVAAVRHSDSAAAVTLTRSLLTSACRNDAMEPRRHDPIRIENIP